MRHAIPSRYANPYSMTSVARGCWPARSPYTPTAHEVEEERQRQENQAELAQITRDYPLPDLNGMTLTYQRTKAGKVWVHQAVKVGDSVEMIPVSTPFGVAARLRFADDDAYGLRIVVPHGRPAP